MKRRTFMEHLRDHWLDLGLLLAAAATLIWFLVDQIAQ
jgi:hypothetical protein